MSVKDEDIGQITMYGDISDVSWWGDEITPKQFKADLDAMGDVKNIEIYLNSGGGDVFAGYTIYNMLVRHKAKKTVYIDGLAASIASLIAMAGDEIIMPANSMMMIHNAWAYMAGNKEELRKMADELEKVDGLLVDTYVKRTGLDRDEIADMMLNETWFTGTEAVEKGFATQVEDSVKMAASLDAKYFNRYHNVPDTVGLVSSGSWEEHITPSIIINGDGTIDYVGVNGSNYVTTNVTSDYIFTNVTDLNNRGESEPVEEIETPVEQEIADALEEQRKEFNRIREKILTKG